ncbi:unnamed protein product [Ectocarpus sp. CCAP 1310/34]|nr:unnamed protein product [Ectocarpus sp. CCAP 1310/34]
MVKKKGKSGRTSLKQKYKIKKRVAEHHRKQKKGAKKNPTTGRKVKDPGIPNSLPFKEEVLAEIAFAKKRVEDRKVLAKEKRRAEMMKRRGLTPDGQTLEGLVSGAEKSQEEFQKVESGKVVAEHQDEDASVRHGQSSRRAYFRELKKVVETADVILEVLDARDPLGSRAQAVEAAVLSKASKKLVLVLNKVDLVPKDVVAKWLKHLRRSFPAIAFKASTQESSSSIKQTKGSADKAADGMLNRSGAVGTEALMGVLKNYCRSLNLKTAITVGVIGYPNVGKSSLINSLKRSKAVGVSATPGFTKSMQEIHLDKTVKLLDCPGIVFDDSDAGATLLRNCVDAEAMTDPTPAVAAVLKRCAPAQLMQVYSIPRFDPDDAFAFLSLVARKIGKLKKGGVPDRVQAAKVVLRDWNTGRVPFFTVPPEDGNGGGAAGAKAAEAMFVEGFGREFDVEAGDAEVLGGLPERDPMDFVSMEAEEVSNGKSWAEREQELSADNDGMDEDDDEDGNKNDDESIEEQESDDDDDDTATTSNMTEAVAAPGNDGGKNDKRAAPRAALDAMLAGDAAINPQVNRSLKKTRKADKKKARREMKRASLSPGKGGEAVGGAYDFSRDFYAGGEQAAGGGAGELSDDDEL